MKFLSGRRQPGQARVTLVASGGDSSKGVLRKYIVILGAGIPLPILLEFGSSSRFLGILVLEIGF